MKMALPCPKIAFFCRMIGEPARGIRVTCFGTTNISWLVYVGLHIPADPLKSNPYNIPAKQHIPNFVGQSHY